MQILRQRSREHLVIKLLARTDLTEERLLPLRSRLRTQLGDLAVTIEPVNELTRRANGKVAVVASAVEVA